MNHAPTGKIPLSKPLPPPPPPAGPLGSISASITVRDLQSYVWQMNRERGFNLTNPSDKMLLLTEEVGELAKAVRKIIGSKFTDATRRTNLEEELADVLIVLLGIASMVEVDILSAVIAKEKINQGREWS